MSDIELILPTRSRVRSLSLRGLSLWIAALVICLQLVADYSTPDTAAPTFVWLIIILAQVVALVACYIVSRKVPSPSSFRWQLVCLYLLIHAAATGMLLWHNLDPFFRYISPGNSTYLSTISLIPILLAVSGTFRKDEPTAIKFIDLFLALTIGLFFFVQVFSVVTATASAPSGDRFIWNVFDTQLFFLACCATLRLAGAVTPSEKFFFYVATVFYWMRAIFMHIHNHALDHDLFIGSLNVTPVRDLLNDVPYLVLMCLAVRQLPLRIREYQPSKTFALLSEGGSPLFMGLGLVLLGISVCRLHFYAGATAIVVAVAGYGLRNGLTLGKLMETEEELRTAKAELESMVVEDSLTGIPNRRAFDHTLNQEWHIAVRTQRPLCLLMIDIDLFKQLNDCYGHHAGDQCLVAIAKIFRQQLSREGEFVCRYGGEEFAVILPGTDLTGASHMAEKLCQAVRTQNIKNRTTSGFVTISIGAAIAGFVAVSSPKDLLLAADEALYKAKRSGRDRIEVAQLKPIEQFTASLSN